MTILLESSPAVLARSGTLEARLAASFAEVDAAMRLRFEVFNLEMNEGLLASYSRGYDTDAYDAYCDHLIVKDHATGAVVGTYRLLSKSRALAGIGFYSENEFDLTRLKRLPGEMLELGRSCVARSHRAAGVIGLLWQAIGHYAASRRARYLFGCASLHSATPAEVGPLYAHLKARHYAPPECRVEPVEACRMRLDDERPEVGEAGHRAAARALPTVVKGYLRAGGVVCGPPAYDAAFGTADVFVLMETARMAARYRARYLEEQLS
jgi:L-ornithine Nalpha-acyltransferase